MNANRLPPDSRPVRRSQSERRTGTRDAIYAAATQCLIESGLGGFKTARVAKLAGVSEGSVFHYFNTKPELLAATMERVFADLRETYERSFAELDPATINGEALVLELWNLMGDDRMMALMELMTTARTDPQLRAALKPVIARHRTTMHARVRRLLSDTPISQSPLLGGAVDALIHATQGLRMHDQVVGNPAHVKVMQDFVALLIDQLLGLGGQPAAKASPSKSPVNRSIAAS
ncbi:MAG: TetR/AcrR family transcriptional regulator [Thermoleophilaceae bacterium]|nr:TetR/AcrR family transcriptional regulator [Thermoleophilaceae bacterium]